MLNRKELSYLDRRFRMFARKRASRFHEWLVQASSTSPQRSRRYGGGPTLSIFRDRSKLLAFRKLNVPRRSERVLPSQLRLSQTAAFETSGAAA